MERKHWSELQPLWLWGPWGDEETVPVIPSDERVAQRMFVLLALHSIVGCVADLRGGMEAPDEAQVLLDRMRTYVEQFCASEPSEREWRLIRQSPGEWTDYDLLQTSWVGEAVWALAWALGLTKYNATNENFEYSEFKFAAVLPLPEVLPLVQRRPQDDIVFEGAVYRSILWRSRQQDYLTGKGFFERRRAWRFIRDMANEMHRSGAFEPPVKGDLAFDGVAFKDMDEDEQSYRTSFAVERLRAFNWLQGQDEIWEEITNDT